jgi:uncharacterized membrane protein YidH (DUF202 family)
MDRDQSAEPPRCDRDMASDIDFPSQPDESCYSIAWDVVIPIILAAIPLAAFRLLGLATQGLDKPEATLPRFVIAAMLVLQTIGIVAMAVLVFWRLGTGLSQLNARTNCQPAAWRRVAVILSVVCLLLTDILANVGAGFAGAGFLLMASVPTFLASLACKGIAFAGIPRGRNRDG